MKIRQVPLARSAWIFDLGAFNPQGRSLEDVLQKFAEKYHFAKAPRNSLDLDEQKSLGFKMGTFVNSKGLPIAIAFNVYNNGFAADTVSSTTDSTDFLLEASAWISTEFGLQIPEDVRYAFLSHVEIESNISIQRTNPKMSNLICSALDSQVKRIDGRPTEFDFGALVFWTEDVNQALVPLPFRFERKIGQPFDSNIYFSQAPLETDAHIKLLDELEKLLGE